MKYCVACPTREVSAWAKYCSPHCRNLYTAYGIGDADYNEMLTQQQGKCAVCGQKQRMRALAVDHDHLIAPVGSPPETLRKAIRGLICYRCNTYALDAVRHSAVFAYSIYKYLNEPPAQKILEGKNE